METQIFKDYAAFDARKDKSVNGVSAEFAEQNPNYREDNLTNVGCWNCSDCIDCIDCSDCRSCSDCRHCSDCSDCRSCHYCRHCSDCSDFQTNPQRITSPVLGSRNTQTVYYWTDSKDLIICGCFSGTLDQFKKQVKETHGDNGHGVAYSNWVQAVEKYKNALL